MDIIYDLEIFPNIFLAGFYHPSFGHLCYEISSRCNANHDLCCQIDEWVRSDCRLVGFNNLLFDYPILHSILAAPTYQPQTNAQLFLLCDRIIRSENRWDHSIPAWKHYIPQIDLYLINHFDNKAKTTSLKVLEFNLRMPNISELPFPPGIPVPLDGFQKLQDYLNNDLDSTYAFYTECVDTIKYRDDISRKYGMDLTNANDTKIGKKYFINRLERESPGCCYKDRKPVQTIVTKLSVQDILSDRVTFEDPELISLMSKICNLDLLTFKELPFVYHGLDCKFAKGGLHASVKRKTFIAGGGYRIIDVDVSSFYPNLAIVNKYHPGHLGDLFCRIYKDIYLERIPHKKGTLENMTLKLALNGGGFGSSGDKYSPFYDMSFMMSITINGQLQLLKLMEMFATAGMQIIQANTDGVTVYIRDSDYVRLKDLCSQWEELTELELEYAEYSRMHVKDVNNYHAVYTDGSTKRKGMYEYKRPHYKDLSALVVPKCAEAVIKGGVDPAVWLRNHDDIYDFYLRTKVPRSGMLLHGYRQQQNVSRYYVSKTGAPLYKVLPPTTKVPRNRIIAVNKGYNATVINRLPDTEPWSNIDYSWYEQRVRKLTDDFSVISA